MVDFFLKIFDFLKHRHSLCYGLIVAMTGILLAMVSSLKYNENIISCHFFLFSKIAHTKSSEIAVTITGYINHLLLLSLWSLRQSEKSQNQQWP